MWNAPLTPQFFIWFIPLLTLTLLLYSTPALFRFQKSGYRASPFYKSYRPLWASDCLFSALFALLAAALFLLGAGAASLTLPLSGGAAFAVCRTLLPTKTPNRLTPRLMRLALGTAALLFVCSSLAAFFFYYALLPFFAPLGLTFFACALWGGIFLLPHTAVPYAATLLAPLEGAIERKYVALAQNKLLASTNTIRVGITGSYGKTTVKHMLNAVLSVKYRVLATPASYNTPSGIAKCINGVEDLPEIFLAELGARRVGDIATLCRFVQPQIGVITAIGSQHLESFGSRAALLSEKGELCRHVKEANGTMVFGTDASLRPLVQDFRGKAQFANQTIRVSLVREDYSGTTVCLSGEGQTTQITLPLFGAHCVSNLALAVETARHFGLNFSQIAEGVRRIQPVPHRLQVLRLPTCTVIDDSFNGNPVGAREALRVLSLFSGRKVVITPGLVELGALSIAENRALGTAVAKAADVAVIIAQENALALKEGLLQGGFPPPNTFFFPNRTPLERVVKAVKRTGDVLLFLNDLPETYR